MIVEDAHGAAPTIPFWRGEAPARTRELSAHVADIRQTVSDLTSDVSARETADQSSAALPAIAWLTSECGVDRAGAEQIVDYLVAGRALLGAVPTQRTIIAERFFDEGGGMQLVIHAPLGARINKAWGLALRKRFCRSFNFELQASATDDGITIALAEQHSFPLADVFAFLRPATVEEVLVQAALPSPIFGTRWRWDATRALALQRVRHGHKVPIHLQRLQSDDLLAAVFPDVAACQENIEGDITIPDHPLVREVMKDVLTEAMDLDGLTQVLRDIDSGQIRTIAVDTPLPSLFAHEILNANPFAFLDDAPLEERRARAVELRRALPETVLEEIGQLDPQAIDEVRRQAWPDVRDASDLHDALLTLIALPTEASADAGPLAARATDAVREWSPWLAELTQQRRAGRATANDRTYWIATESQHTFLQAYEGATVLDALPEIPGKTLAPVDARVAIVQGWVSHSGPTDASELSAVTGLSESDIEEALLRLEAAGWALRGRFASSTSNFELRTSKDALDGALAFQSSKFAVQSSALAVEWCERRLLARIHRLTIGALRREIAPVSSGDLMRWLREWQHVAPGTQLSGEAGLLEILRQLQGFEAPANAWEAHLLRQRAAEYDPTDLDRLCFSGVVGWGRLSPHPATLEPRETTRRVVPTSVAPITFFVREDADWLAARHDAAGAPTHAGLSPNGRDLHAYLDRHGASFFTDIVRGTKQLPSEVEAALWELVAAGLVTADGFDNLRALLDPKRRSGHGSGRTARPRHAAGRWAVLPHPAPDASDRARAIESACWMLLRRYGVVFRELLVRESILPPWRELLMAFRRLEDRGEIRGGRFVNGFVGEQFALPAAVESLRAFRHRATTSAAVEVATSDPLNLAGVVMPGPRVPAVPGHRVAV
jgi:ATP-dependent Lhr-like helicase